MHVLIKRRLRRRPRFLSAQYRKRFPSRAQRWLPRALVTMSLPSLDEDSLDELYQWLEKIPFSRPTKNLTRDFSDGILVAEIIAHFLPRYVDLHNFMPANSSALKRYNWETLNKKVFQQLNFHVSTQLIQQIVNLKPGAVEFMLSNLRMKIDLVASQHRFKPRKFRSRSSSRAGSNLSLNSVASDDGSGLPPSTSTDGNSKALSPRDRPANLLKLGISPPSPNKKGHLCEDLVPGRLLHHAKQEVLNKEEQIQTLHTRVRHLERVVNLKDERIVQLTQRLDRLAQVFYAQHQQKFGETAPPKPPPTAQSILASLLNLTRAVDPSENGGLSDTNEST